MSTELPDLGPKYVIERPLARGGAAPVFLARHVGPGGFSRPVVIKTISAEASGEERLRQTLQCEAQVAALASHPNIVRLYDFGEQKGLLYLVFEHLEGRSLDEIRRSALAARQAVPPAFVATVGAQVCAALAYLHALKGPDGKPLGAVHRDVSPSSVVACADGAIKLLDLGIAQLAASQARKERGLIQGRPPYLSPEQCMAKPLDGRSDLFSLGVVLWELATGRRLVEGEDLQHVLKAISGGRAPSVRSQVPDFPEPLAQAIDRALELEPQDRFANAAEMGRPFEEHLAQLRQGAGAPPLPPPVAGDASGATDVEPVVVAALEDLERWRSAAEASSRPLELAVGPGQLSPPPPPGMPFTPAVTLEEPVSRPPLTGEAGVVRIPDAEALGRRNRRIVFGVVATVLAVSAIGLGWRLFAGAAPAEDPLTFDKRFKVHTDPEGATVTLDGRALGTTPYVAQEPLPPGEHLLNVEREGFAPVARTVRAGSVEVFITLEPVHQHTRAPTPGVEKKAPAPLPAIIITYPDAGEDEVPGKAAAVSP